jgi:hypothetical protein
LKDHFASVFPKAGAKVLLFFELTKFFDKKNQKKCIFAEFIGYLNRLLVLFRFVKHSFHGRIAIGETFHRYVL